MNMTRQFDFGHGVHQPEPQERRVYKIVGGCHNCGEEGDMHLPYGVPTGEAPCPTCGCTGVYRNVDPRREDLRDRVTEAPGTTYGGEQGMGGPAMPMDPDMEREREVPRRNTMPARMTEDAPMERPLTAADVMSASGRDELSRLAPHLAAMQEMLRGVVSNAFGDDFVRLVTHEGPVGRDTFIMGLSMLVAHRTEGLRRCGSQAEAADFAATVFRENVDSMMRVTLSRWTDGRGIHEDQRILEAADPFLEARAIMEQMRGPQPMGEGGPMPAESGRD